MGLLDAFAAGLAGGAKSMADDIEQELKMERQQALEEARMAAQEAMQVRAEERQRAGRREDDEYAFNKKKERAPEEAKMAADRIVSEGKAKLDPSLVEAQRNKDIGDEQAKLQFKSENIKEIARNERILADARANPTERAAAELRLKEAKLRLGEAEADAESKKTVRGLLNAGDSVDMSQPGAEKARDFYRSEAERKTRDEQIVDGKAPIGSDRATSAQRAAQWLKMAENEMDPAKAQQYRDNAAAELESARPGKKKPDEKPKGAWGIKQLH